MLVQIIWIAGLIACSVAGQDKNTCDECNSFVQNVGASLVPTMQKNVAIVLADQVCVKIQASKYDDCKNYTQALLSSLLNFAPQKLCSEEVCQILKQCPNVSPPKLAPHDSSILKSFVPNSNKIISVGAAPKPTPKPPTPTPTPARTPTPPSQECEYCQLAEGEISMLLQNDEAKSIIKSELGVICNELPFNSVKCMNLLDVYVDQLFHLIQQYLSQDSFCVEFEYCPEGEEVAVLQSSKSGALSKIQHFSDVVMKDIMPSAECQYCQLAEGEISMLLQNEQAKNIVKEDLGVICNELPFNSVECANLLALYVDQLFHLLQQYLQADELCVEAEMCPKAQISAPKPAMQTMPSPNAQCQYCQLAEGEISMLLHNQQAKAIVKADLGVICNELAFDSVECENLLGLYIDQLFHILLQYLQDDELCVEAEMCPKAETLLKQDITQKKQIVLQKEVGILPSAECQYCQLAEGEISMLLQNEQAKNIVKEDLGVICNELPFNSVECTNLLALYVDQLFHLLQQYLQDDELCVEAELCPKAQISEPKPALKNLRTMPSPNAQCQYCQLAEGEISMLLHNQQAKAIVKADLGVICNELAFDSVECENLLGLYIDQLFHILLQYLQDDELCVEAEMCPKAQFEIKNQPANNFESTRDQMQMVPFVSILPSAECQYCQLAEGEISMLLQNEQAKNIVKEDLDVVCNELPFNSVECANLLALYVDQLFHILLQYLQDDELCVEAEVCPKSYISSKKPTLKNLLVTPIPNAECQYCELAEGEISMLLENQQAEAIVKADLGIICNELAFDSVSCENLLGLYVDQLFHNLQAYLAADRFCVEFGYCPKEQMVTSGELFTE